LLSDPAHPVLALATYQRGELHRVRGELDAAEQAYLTAATLGFDPNPGLALLRLAQGRLDEAEAAAHRMVEHHPTTLSGAAHLAAAVEVFLATGDVARARSAFDELAALAAGSDVGLLRTLSALAAGQLALAEGRVAAALGDFQAARAAALEVDLPFDAARAGVGVARASLALGDRPSAAAELEAALATLDRLGARGESAAVRELLGAPAPGGRLTRREEEVLRLVADGRTNREIASSLHISAHTVARHVQNIFAKLGSTSRAAAIAHAYEHGLLRRGDQRHPR
jgi:ATP/maltotriose-dependent transcriptional regulator MalT